jgi:hypothetical protein
MTQYTVGVQTTSVAVAVAAVGKSANGTPVFITTDVPGALTFAPYVVATGGTSAVVHAVVFSTDRPHG